MQRCDVLVVGGGPAGSTCARELVRAGLDVIVADKATFPRDKICAGWITPPVVTELGLDIAEYGRARTIDPIFGFRVGRMGDKVHEIRYGQPMSYGIRRCELDHYLLAASGARIAEGRRLEKFERDGKSGWIVDDEFSASVLVGAGGHFCPVARAVGGAGRGPVITAEEVEFSLEEDELEGCDVEPGVPELYYTRDLTGYGWAFRKAGYVNIGLGVRPDPCAAPTGERGGKRLSHRIDDFLAYLKAGRRIGRAPKKKMSGHAYLLKPDSRRTAAGNGFVLVGDAAGLAYDRSGEGIRPAVESALLAARSIRRAFVENAADRGAFKDYALALENRFGRNGLDPAAVLPAPVLRGLASSLMNSRWFSRHVLLERWFLHTHEEPLAA
jgi:flavin-dependent dehydrogenase